MRRSLFACLLLAGTSEAAFADDLSVTSILKSPIATSHAANSTPGNITINAGGGVDVSVAGAAATIDSSNSIDNLGVIQNTNSGNAVGVHIIGGNAGTFTNETGASTSISAGGGGANNIGVLLDGPSAFNGNIDLVFGGNLVAIGTNSIGVSIQAPLNGNLTEGATGSLVGQGITGVLVAAPVSGSLTTAGGISVSGTATFGSTAINPLSGSAVAVGANIAGGILNAGPTGPGDTTTASTLTAAGSLPTLAIQPSVAGANASNITIGILSDTTNPNFSLINRGTIKASFNQPGINTIAVEIGNSSASAHTVTLSGGIYNNGSIVAAAESDNKFATSVAAAPTNATALIIGNGAFINTSGSVPQALFNNGTISSSVTSSSLTGGQPEIATALLIQPGSSLPSLTSTSTIIATALTSDATTSSLSAYGIRDLSGTLTNVVISSGSLQASASGLNNNAQVNIAADLSHSTAKESFTTNGSVIGDVLFGSAGTSGGVAGNQLVIEGTNASVQGAVTAAGHGTIDVHLSQGGTGGTLDTANAQIASLNVGELGNVAMALNKTSAVAPVISASGTVTFGFGSKVTLVPTSFLPNNGTYTLIHSAGGLQFADFTDTTNQQIPFIFNGTIGHDNNNLTITLQRKTASQLGLTGNLATIYEPLATAALADNPFGAALLTLGNAADVQTAISSAVPDVTGGVRALAIAMTDQATGVIGARERELVLQAPKSGDEFRFWAQEVYNQVSLASSPNNAGYDGAGEGVAFGVEWGALANVRYGLGYTFFTSYVSESHPRDTKTDVTWHQLSFYAGWRPGNFFVTPEVNVGIGEFSGRRTITAGNFTTSATASWSGLLGAGGVTTGYVFNLGNFEIVPQFAADGLYLRENAYNENAPENGGTSGIGLSLRQQDEKSIRGFIGVLSRGNFTWDIGTFQPQLLIGWSHEFANTPVAIDGSFQSAPNSPFHLVGPPLESERFIGGAGVAYVVGNWSVGINYDAAVNAGTVAQSATVNLSSRF